MTIAKQYVKYSGIDVPEIKGSKGGGKGGGGSQAAPNSMFSTDFLFLTTAIGEGPVYRINPNGPQDVQIQDSSIDDLLNLNTDGSINADNFGLAYTTGTVTQSPIPLFGDAIITPQSFASPVSLRSGPPAVDDGNLYGPPSAVSLQPTSPYPWDALRFMFTLEALAKIDGDGNINPHSLQVRIRLWKSDGVTAISPLINGYILNISGKTDKPVRRSYEIQIPPMFQDENGYVFSIEKISQDWYDVKTQDAISVTGWLEIENKKQAYPRTAIIGYALKAVNEHVGGIPTFTSMAKGLIVKVPSNYNQPVLSREEITNKPGVYYERAGEIDWRNLEVGDSYTSTRGYYLQKPGASTRVFNVDPQIYIGTWDGTFVYSWTQNPVWIIYDILTNNTYGLGIPEENIDRYKFYQVAQYCDACDPTTGKFIGVSGLADGSYRYKPLGLYGTVRENQQGLLEGTPIKERRFITDVSIVDQEKSMDLLNKIASTFRGMLIYSGSKITLAVDMPDEYPVMMFNEATIKQGTFQISGSKESDIYTGIDVNYIEPTNHFKRETVRIDTADSNDGVSTSDIENIASLDLVGVTRRSQAVRMAQYHIAASKYQRRTVTFTTSTDAIHLAPGDIISIASRSSGVAYGYGGKIASNSAIASSSNSNVMLEHFTVPSITSNVFTANTYPLTLRVLNQASDRLETYLISNTVYSLSTSNNVSGGIDLATVKVLSKFNKNTKTFVDITSTGFTANLAPKAGDLWSLGEIQNPLNYYSDKSSKLFKVTNLKREPGAEEVSVTAIEYISNVYIDSDTFINYQPTAYIDSTSAFAPPPAPNFTITTVPRTKLDGTVVVDGLLKTTTQRLNYSQKFETEYYVSTGVETSLISNVTATTPLTLIAANVTALANTSGSPNSVLTGKNGFSSDIGNIKLLCNAVTTSVGSVQLTIEGLSQCIDANYNKHVLDLASVTVGSNKVTIPLKTKQSTNNGIRNFVGFVPEYTNFTKDVSYVVGTNTLTFTDEFINSNKLSSLLPAAPFYVSIKQPLNTTTYANNSFYVDGTEYTYLKTGSVTKAITNTIDVDIKPRHANFVRFYVDGIQVNSPTVNINKSLSIPANIVYSATSFNSTYRVEIDHYTVPTIEVGDLLEVTAGNSFVVANTSYDSASANYSAGLTSNSIFRIELLSKPTFNLTGLAFINTSPNPVGKVSNVSGASFTLDYDKAVYPGNFRLANNNIYSIDLDASFSKRFLVGDSTLPELSLGSTTVRARNKNTIGRYSPYVYKSVYVSAIPIQRVENITLTESIFIEQTGGASVRVTVSFPAIEKQSVTDYEISYKLFLNEGVTTGLIDSGLQSYNTVKVSAKAVDTDNYIRYTINNLNRGSTAGVNVLLVRVTPINKNIRGVSYEISYPIQGKTTPPLNVQRVSAGQQADIILLSWEYERGANGQLYDLDLKEVEIRRLPGVVDVTLDNYIKSEKVASVSPPSSNKSIPLDNFGTYTYMFRSVDSSGNYSASIVGTTLTTVKSQTYTTVAAYNEDDPTTPFTEIVNTNSTESRFPSFANSTNGGLSSPTSSKVDNANGSSSGWSTLPAAPTDLKAVGTAVYYTQIRDFGQDVTAFVNIDTNMTQEIQSTYNDQHVAVLRSVSDTHFSTFAYNNNVSISAKESNSTDLFFSNTGSYMYVVGTTATANIYQYNLTSAWNVATAVFESNLAIGGRDSSPQSIFFRDDGRKMYFVGGTTDRVFEYDVATPWVVNTATYLQNVSVASQDLTPNGLAFSSNGTFMYMLGSTTDNLYQYTLSTPWDVTTATVTTSVSVATRDTAPSGISFNDLGTRAYIVGSQKDNVNRYTLSQAWNIATMSPFNNVSVGIETLPSGVYVKPYEDSIYIVGSANDRVQHFRVVSTSSPNVLIDSDYGGIGYYLGFNNPSKTTGRYDNTNKTWVDGGTGGNVWAIWNHGQFVGDVANANTYALIAGLINANAIALGASYYANGNPTGSNSFANVTNGGSAYTLVDLRQYSDLGTSTYSGEAGIVAAQTFIRTSTANVYFANGNVNSLAFSSTGDGYLPYAAGKRTFRYLQFKYLLNNGDPDTYDAVLDRFRYSIEKPMTSYTNTFVYSNALGMTIDFSSAKFVYVPTLSVNVKTISNGTTNLTIAVFTSISNSAVTLLLANVNGTGYYPGNNTATVMLTAQGV